MNTARREDAAPKAREGFHALAAKCSACQVRSGTRSYEMRTLISWVNQTNRICNFQIEHFRGFVETVEPNKIRMSALNPIEH
jgi:hypothetical protein